MAIFFDAASNGFYHDGIHEVIPEGSVEITAADHQALMDAQEAGQSIVSDEGGRPIARDYTFTADQLNTQIKSLASIKILAIAPQWKQTNMMARAIELEHKARTSGLLSADEQLELDGFGAIWARVKAIRDYSDGLEASVVNDLTLDIHAGWPS